MEKKEYLDNVIKPIMENLIFSLVSEKPDDPYPFMIDWLRKTGGYINEGLTTEELKELNELKIDVLKYRALEHQPSIFEDDEHEQVVAPVESKKEPVKVQEIKKEPPKTESKPHKDKKKNHSDESGSESEEEDHGNHFDVIEARKKQIKGKGPRVGVSAETYGKFNKKEDFEPRFIKKNENQINRIKGRILQSFIFSNLEQKDVNSVIGAMDEKIFNPGEYVIKQGEQGDCLFVIESGDFDCYKKFTKDGQDVLVKSYTSGDSFGELALLYNAPRAASVVAKTKSICWALDRETFNNIVKDAARKKREKYETFLRSVNILESIEDYELTQICDAVKACSFKPGEYVIKEVKFVIKF
jgi:cAMP-dependent protein kinase regulator